MERRFEILPTKYGWAVFGEIPINVVGMLARTLGKNAVLAPIPCASLGAVIAFAYSKELADEWAAELKKGSGGDWLADRDFGVSSLTIYETLRSESMTKYSGRIEIGETPADASDFGRCYRLLERFPQWNSRLIEVAEKYPKWSRIIENWPMLRGLFEQKDFFAMNSRLRDLTK